MNKSEFQKLLKKNKIDFFELSLNTNKSNDLDVYINPNDKSKFEKLLKNKNFLKRKELGGGHKNRFFYFNEDKFINLIIDVSYNITFYKNNFYSYRFKFTNDLFKKNNSKIENSKQFYFFIIYIARLLWLKESNLSNINKFIFDKKNARFRRILKISKKFFLINEIENFIKFFFHKNFYLKSYFNWKFNSNIILFLGSDGVGKTTLIKNMQSLLKSKSFYMHMGISKKHWYSNFLKNIFIKSQHKYTFFKSLILLIDLSLKVLMIKKNIKKHFILIDRYPGYIFFSDSFLKFFYKIILPKPDLIFLITASSKSRKIRKPLEYKKDEVKWIRLAKSLKVKVFKLNSTSLPKKVMAKKAIKIVFSNKKFYNKLFY